jgi:hypothetical protein
MKAVAEELCGGRLVVAHEGGYSTAYVPFCGLAIIEELSGIATRVADPFLPGLETFGGQELQPHQAAAVAAAAIHVGDVPRRSASRVSP